MVRTLWNDATLVKNIDCPFSGFYQISKDDDSTLKDPGKMNTIQIEDSHCRDPPAHSGRAEGLGRCGGVDRK